MKNFTYRVRMRFVSSLLVAALVTVLASSANAQLISHGDLFGPGAPPPMVGVEVGFGSHSQHGSYQAACRCEFPDGSGSGTGFMGALVFELPLSYEWVVGLKAGVDFKNTTSRVSVLDTATIQFQSGNQDSVTFGTVKFDRIGVVKFTYLTLAPFVQYQFFRLGPFIQAGLGVSILMSSHFTHQRELTSTTVQLNDGSTIPDVRFNNGTLDETLQDGEVTDAKKLRLGALLGVGYDISLNDRAVVAPMFTYDLPLGTIRETLATGWKISSLFGSIQLKYKLN